VSGSPGPGGGLLHAHVITVIILRRRVCCVFFIIFTCTRLVFCTHTGSIVVDSIPPRIDCEDADARCRGFLVDLAHFVVGEGKQRYGFIHIVSVRRNFAALNRGAVLGAIHRMNGTIFPDSSSSTHPHFATVPMFRRTSLAHLTALVPASLVLLTLVVVAR